MLALAAIIAYAGYERSKGSPAQTAQPAPSSGSVDESATLSNAIATRASGVHVEAGGTIARVLPDDNNGSRHQRFIVRLRSGQTVLIAHNVDIASRIPSLRQGSAVTFSGDYEWNEKGGVVHWTHSDPKNEHRAGWIKYDGRLFQ